MKSNLVRNKYKTLVFQQAKKSATRICIKSPPICSNTVKAGTLYCTLWKRTYLHCITNAFDL